MSEKAAAHPLTNEPTLEQSINEITSSVEEILKHGWENDETDSIFFELLSVNPDTVAAEVNEKFLYSRCGDFSFRLQMPLIRRGIMADLVTSELKKSSGHLYLSIKNKSNQEIIVDPTIGQFIKGHLHVFIGTRAQLKSLIENQTGEGEKYQIIHTKKPKQAFERIWGSSGRIIATAEEVAKNMG